MIYSILFACHLLASTTILAYVFICGVAATSTVATAAPTSAATTVRSSANASCAFRWESYHSSPFMRESGGEYRFQYIEKLALAEVNGQRHNQPKIPLDIFFSPAPDAYLGGKLLGRGWWFPAFESTLIQTNANTFVMGLPNGDKITLHKKGNSLSGDVWLGTLGNREIVLKTACGWSVKFLLGRLVELTSPTSERYLFTTSREGNRTISYNGRVIATLIRKIDERTTFPVYHLSYIADGKSKKAELRIGTRPALTKFSEKVNGRYVTKERKENTSTLSSVKIEGREEKKYTFGLNSLSIGKNLFAWDNATSRLTEGNGEKYSFVKIRNIECMQTTFPDGSTSLYGSGKEDIHVSKDSRGTIKITEGIRLGGRDLKPRKTFEIIDGREEFISQHWYDEKGMERRLLVKTPEGMRRYDRTDDSLTAKDAASGKVLWKKRYDSQKNLIEFQKGETSYQFVKDETKKGFVIIKQISPSGTQQRSVPQSLFDSLIEKL